MSCMHYLDDEPMNEAASFFGWSNRLRGKNKKGRWRDRQHCGPDPTQCGAWN